MFDSLDPKYSEKTYSVVGALAVTDFLMSATTTDDTDPHTYVSTDFDGVYDFAAARTVTVTSSTTPANFNTTDPIVVTGLDVNGSIVTEDFLLTAAGGGETLVGLIGFVSITSILVPIQLDTSGTLEFGVQDIVINGIVRDIRVATGGGNMKVTYRNGTTDTIPAITNGEHLPYSPAKIWGDSDTTVTNITLAF